MEESLDLSYGDFRMLDQNAVLTDQGLAGKLAEVEVSPGLCIIETFVCKPIQPLTLSELAAMSIVDVRELESLSGSEVRLLCLKSDR